MPTYLREKCLCCECRFYEPSLLPLYLANSSTPTICFAERCKKDELAIGDRVAKGYCKYFEVYE